MIDQPNTIDLTPAGRARLREVFDKRYETNAAYEGWGSVSAWAFPAALARIDRLEEEINDARKEAFSRGFRRDCDDDDPEAVVEADYLPSLVAWIAESEAEARAQRDNALAEIKRLEAIVDRLPKTINGVPITPGMRIWSEAFRRYFVVDSVKTKYPIVMFSRVEDGWGITDPEQMAMTDSYSTEAAARAAKRSIDPNYCPPPVECRNGMEETSDG